MTNPQAQQILERMNARLRRMQELESVRNHTFTQLAEILALAIEADADLKEVQAWSDAVRVVEMARAA